MHKIIGILLLILIIFASGQLRAQVNGQPHNFPQQYDIAAGLGAFYIPGVGGSFQKPEFAGYGGIQQPIGGRQLLNIGLRLGYARGKYQGDALQLQLLLHITPTIAQQLEPGIAIGAGYQFSFYPSQPLVWSDGSWKKGKSNKGIFQIPLQLSLGYRVARHLRYDFRPYVAYQLKVLRAYSPEIPLLPVSETLIGLKFSSLDYNW